MKKLEIGDNVYICENSQVLLGLPDGCEYTIKDILELKYDSPYVLSCEEHGKDWVGFFGKNELIKTDIYE